MIVFAVTETLLEILDVFVSTAIPDDVCTFRSLIREGSCLPSRESACLNTALIVALSLNNFFFREFVNIALLGFKSASCSLSLILSAPSALLEEDDEEGQGNDMYAGCDEDESRPTGCPCTEIELVSSPAMTM
jgi:hypothetical protein